MKVMVKGEDDYGDALYAVFDLTPATWNVIREIQAKCGALAPAPFTVGNCTLTELLYDFPVECILLRCTPFLPSEDHEADLHKLGIAMLPDYFNVKVHAEYQANVCHKGHAELVITRDDVKWIIYEGGEPEVATRTALFFSEWLDRYISPSAIT